MERLFEIFERVNKIKLSENLNPNSQAIVNDILSLNEDIGAIKNKIIEYGQKGLLTLAIVLAVAQGVQANQIKDVLDTGMEYTSSVNNKDFYSACVGYVAKLGEKEKTDLSRKQGLIESRMYFESLRDGVQPRQLSNEGKITVDFVLSQFQHNPNYVQLYKNLGQSLHTKA